MDGTSAAMASRRRESVTRTPPSVSSSRPEAGASPVRWSRPPESVPGGAGCPASYREPPLRSKLRRYASRTAVISTLPMWSEISAPDSDVCFYREAHLCVGRVLGLDHSLNEPFEAPASRRSHRKQDLPLGGVRPPPCNRLSSLERPPAQGHQAEPPMSPRPRTTRRPRPSLWRALAPGTKRIQCRDSRHSSPPRLSMSPNACAFRWTQCSLGP